MISEREAWAALRRHHEQVRDVHLRTLFAEGRNRGERLDRRGGRPLPRLLEEPDHRRDAARCCSSWPQARGAARAHRRDVPRREDQHHRGPRGAARGAAGARGRGDRGRRRERGARGARGAATRWPTSPTRVRERRLDRPHRQAHPQRRQHRHRRLRPGPGRWPTRRCATTAERGMTFRFVSNVDGTDFCEATRDLDPAETLFIVSSKTFTTLETLTNARAARDWLLAGAAATRRRWPSTSSPCRPTPTEVAKFGIDTANMFEFWDWVGGRYSFDSAIGLSLMIAIGPEQLPRDARRLPRDGRALPHRAVRAEPAGAARPDRRLVRQLLRRRRRHAVLPYSQYLARFPAYLQQLDMESNGKSVDRDGSRVDYQTGPDRVGHAGHQRPARLLPAHPPGHEADPVPTSSASPGP